jgi:two-component system CheB/CheR fusion protein
MPTKKSAVSRVRSTKKRHKRGSDSSAGGPTLVGVGASAGGLEAIGQLLTDLPANTGLAFIVVQHLDPTHESLSAELLGRKTRMSVIEATDGMLLEPDHIYVIPPNRNLAVHDGSLKVSPRSDAQGQHLPINFLFQSIAENHGHQSIGVILSGNATDGTLGLEAIKAAGGVTIVQDPKTAKFDSMPVNAIASGVVDLILSPSEIARELANIALHPFAYRHDLSVGGASDDPALRDFDQAAFAKILSLIRGQFNVDFDQYKQSTLKRRIARRMILNKIHTVEEYARSLQGRPEEAQALFSDMLINVTEFFRDPEAYAHLAQKILPEVAKNRLPNQPIRIWSVGCSSGEEPYSIAMTLLEVLGPAANKNRIQIFATDISESAIAKARAGIFPDSISEKISKERLRRFFSKVDGGYRIDKTIRDMCLFSRHDVTRDPPFARLDLICCRNVLIYFEPDLQKRVFPIFHYALCPNGYLWLGRSETVGRSSDLFAAIDKTQKFYARKAVASTTQPRFWMAPHQSVGLAQKGSELQRVDFDIQREADRQVIAQYAPPGVVVNFEMDIVLTRGMIDPFIKFPPGVASLNIFKWIRPEIQSDVRLTLQASLKGGVAVRKEGLEVRDGDKVLAFNLHVVPLRKASKSQAGFFSVNFEPASLVESPVVLDRHHAESTTHRSKATKVKDSRAEARALKLEREIAEVRAWQLATVQDFEATKDQLVAANEELQSRSEEYQSTNEELETAKEELQSANEELTTVNDELQTHNADLSALNNDLNNFMECVEIPLVMVDSNHQIRRFTSRASTMMNLLTSDIGRPIGDIKPNLETPDLTTMVGDVIKTAVGKDFEVQDRDGHWFRLQVKPYRTASSKVDGAVISLVDIDLLKRHLNEREKSLEYALSVANAVQLPLAVLDAKLRLQSSNVAFGKLFELSSDVVGSDVLSIVTTAEHREFLRQALEGVVFRREELRELEVETKFPKLGRRILHFSTALIKWIGVEPQPPAFLLAVEDITERRRVEENSRATELKFRALVDSAYDAIVSVNGDGILTFANKKAEEIFGYDAGELVGKHMSVLIPERLHVQHEAHHALYLTQPSSRPMGRGQDLVARTKDGREIPVDVSLSPYKTFDDVIVTAIIRDITGRKAMESEREALLALEHSARCDAERANQTKDTFLALLSHELRTPLTAILSWSQLIQRKNLDPSRIKLGVETIEKNALLQGQLIDDLLDIARIKAGKFMLNLGEIDPAEPVLEAVNSVAMMAEANSIKIESFVDVRRGTVVADPKRLQQVVWNLLTNAIKFSPKGQSIAVRIEPLECEGLRQVAIKVIDHGKGIKPELLETIFGRFIQADSSAARLHGGLGLGLSIVHDLIKLQGGSVSAESSGEGCGATFTILLPMKADSNSSAWHPVETRFAEQKAKQRLGEQKSDLTGLSLLVVDDEVSSRDALAETLSSFGARTFSFSSAAAALEALGSFEADILISDIAMPGEDGLSLIKKIRALGPKGRGDIPALALTAYASKEDVSLALAAGFDAHLAKPYDITQLAQMVLQLAKKKRR